MKGVARIMRHQRKKHMLRHLPYPRHRALNQIVHRVTEGTNDRLRPLERTRRLELSTDRTGTIRRGVPHRLQ